MYQKVKNEKSIYMGLFTIKRTYKKMKTSKFFDTETIRLSKKFVFKGDKPEEIIRRYGILKQLRDESGWSRGKIEIIEIDILVYTGQSQQEDYLLDITKENL